MEKFVTKKFPKIDLQSLLWEESDYLTVISDTISDMGRWSIHHELIFSDAEGTYLVNYSQGATEQQDELPFEYEGDEVTCYKVKGVRVETTEWRKVPLDEVGN